MLDLLAIAYDFRYGNSPAGSFCCSESRIEIRTPGQHLPNQPFDLMLTLPIQPQQALRNEILKKFGLAAHRESRTTDVLILKVNNPEAPGLKTGTPSPNATNTPIPQLAQYVESILQKPILDQTGLTNCYALRFEPVQTAHGFEYSEEMFRRIFLEQLGLDLAPSRQPIEILVVEKAP
jgi:uncharacterized protein (TIGR03435 family)